MKRAIYLLLSTFLFAVIFTKCQQDTETSGPVTSDVQDAQNEAVTESVFEDLDDVTYYGDVYTTENGRIANDEESPIHCANVSIDRESKTITIDFGDGCQDPFGRVRSGKIIITFTDHLFMPGAQQTVTFENYSVDSIQVEGIFTKTNISEDLRDTLKYEVKLEGGKLTWPDGTFATRNADWINKRIRALNPINDVRIHDGNASGVTRSGANYTVQITKPIVWMRGCLPHKRVFIPVEGIKVKTIEGGPTITIDWGDGTCDNLYTVTKDGINL